ncbi:hypothetical protein V1514DRAFT_327116 [Lipomyces japonicus]|uniref:uncharacterized protein n=1 Tax=Lipomyces japonicus TaxID=56871 RepID=UPI0034CE5BFD
MASIRIFPSKPVIRRFESNNVASMVFRGGAFQSIPSRAFLASPTAFAGKYTSKNKYGKPPSYPLKSSFKSHNSGPTLIRSDVFDEYLRTGKHSSGPSKGTRGTKDIKATEETFGPSNYTIFNEIENHKVVPKIRLRTGESHSKVTLAQLPTLNSSAGRTLFVSDPRNLDGTMRQLEKLVTTAKIREVYHAQKKFEDPHIKRKRLRAKATFTKFSDSLHAMAKLFTKYRRMGY